MSEKKDNATKTVGLVMIIMLVGKLTGLYRDILLRKAYGTDTIEAMAFSFASNIPRNFLDFAFASVISASFIPIFNAYLERKDKKQAFELANNFISIIIVLSGVFTVIGILFAMPVVNIWASGYQPEAKTLASQLLRIMMLTIVISGTAFSLTGVLQSLGEFNIPAAMSVISNLLIIFYYTFLIDRFGVFGLAVTYILGWTTQILIQIPSLLKKGYRFAFSFNLRHPGLKEIAMLMLPVLVSSWVMPINVMVNQNVASTLYDGAGYTVVDTANQLFSVITGIFILSIANVIFPKLSKQKAGDDPTAFSDTMRATIHGMLFFLIPMSAGLFVLSEPIVRLFFERGAFDAVSTERTSIALKFYSFGMVGYGLQTIVSRAFYAGKDGKTPMITGIIAIVLNLVLSYTMIQYFGIGGPAFASSVSITATAVIMIAVLNRQSKGIFTKKMAADCVKMIFSAIVMAFAVNCFINHFIFIPVICGLAVYIILTFLLKIEEACMIFSFIRRLKK